MSDKHIGDLVAPLTSDDYFGIVVGREKDHWIIMWFRPNGEIMKTSTVREEDVLSRIRKFQKKYNS